MNCTSLQLNKLFNFLLPKICPGCNSVVNIPKKYICDNCIRKITVAGNERIKREYKRDFESDNFIASFTALFVFEKGKELQEIIHALKYGKKFLIGKELGELIADRKAAEISNWSIDIVVPIPLHRIKTHERGYNQSLFISEGLSRVIDIDINNKILERVKYTDSQTKMKRDDRKRNMRNAFKVKMPEEVRGKNILLVDDLITTGATANECAKKLKKAGANNVYLAAVALAD
ncbi:MAG: ComF family protein [Bacteroidota bacterium]|nr:ComF family protein [Bacteroidota bacterium]